MPDRQPDPAERPTPLLKELAPGLALWRVHADRYAPAAFNPTRPTGVSGGRFDSPTGAYAHLYAAGDVAGCVCEVLLRDRLDARPVWIPRARLAGAMLSKLVVTQPVSVVVLHGAGLAALGQDAWLTSCGPRSYATTRAWATAIRDWAPSAAGLVWRARHDNDRFAYVFFSDRTPSTSFDVEHAYRVGEPGRGFSLLRRAAQQHNAVVHLGPSR